MLQEAAARCTSADRRDGVMSYLGANGVMLVPVKPGQGKDAARMQDGEGM